MFRKFRSANPPLATLRVAAVLLALADEVIEISNQSCANLVALAHSRFWQIVLQKSFCTRIQKF
jgi:hypothetical protein